MKKVAVVGAGGHGKVVVATARAVGFEVVGLYDDDAEKRGRDLLGVPVRGPVAAVERAGCPVIVAVGENRTRRALCEGIQAPFATLVHPAAVVHPSVAVGEGTVIFAGSVIQPDTRIGRHVIVNTGATVDHDCEIGDWAHCGPGSHLAGCVTVGEGALVGIGSSVIPELRIGSWAVLGAGASAVANVPDGARAVGVPARPFS